MVNHKQKMYYLKNGKANKKLRKGNKFGSQKNLGKEKRKQRAKISTNALVRDQKAKIFY